MVDHRKKNVMLLFAGCFLIYHLLLHYIWVRSDPKITKPCLNEDMKEKSERVESTINSLKYDAKCGRMFQEISFNKPDHWEVPTCKVKPYNTSDLKTCLMKENVTIVNIGDSRHRQLYYALVDIFKGNAIAPHGAERQYKSWGFEDIKNYAFFKYYQHRYVNENLYSLISGWLRTSNKRPDLIIIGSAAWYVADSRKHKAYNNSATVLLPTFEGRIIWNFLFDSADRDAGVAALRNVSRLLVELSKSTTIIWVSQAQCCNVPNSTEKYNDVAEAILNESKIIFWKSAYQIAKLLFHEAPDPTHYSVNALQVLWNIILNFFCNSKINVSEDYCCASSIR